MSGKSEHLVGEHLRKFSFDPQLLTAEYIGVNGRTLINGRAVTNSENKNKLDYDRVGLGISLLGHIIMFYFVFFGMPVWQRVPKNVIYSVSLEGSNKLGGIQQVPKGKQDTPIAPPKKTSQPEPPKSVEKTTKPEPVKKTVAVKPEEKAEISIKEKPKPKTTPPPPKKVAEPAKKTEVAKQQTKSDSKAKPVDTKAQVNKNFEQALQRYLGESTNAGGVGFGGDGRGGRAMGGGIVKPPEWFLYKDLLESTIKRGWNWHDTSAALIASVSFKISERGEVSDVMLVQSSGNSYYDESIVRAVKKASPVPIPPPQFYSDFRFVELDFKPQ